MGWSQYDVPSTPNCWRLPHWVDSMKMRNIWKVISQECLKWPCVYMPQSLSAFLVVLHIPVWALQTGLLSIERVDEVRVLLADVGEAWVVGGCIWSERPVIHVGHCKCYTDRSLSVVYTTDTSSLNQQSRVPGVILFLLSSLKPCRVFTPLWSRLDIMPSFTGQ